MILLLCFIVHGSLDDSMFIMTVIASDIETGTQSETRILYDSSDGITYTRITFETTFVGDNIDGDIMNVGVDGDTMNFGGEIHYDEDVWDDVIGYFMRVEGERLFWRTV